MFILAGFAFLSGIITILSPCILPVLPVVLAGSAVKGKRRPLGIVAGFIASFTLLTVSLATLTRLTGIGPGLLRGAAVVVLVVFGLVMLVPRFSMLFEKAAAHITSGVQPGRKDAKGYNPAAGTAQGFFSGLPVGVSLGVLWTPCVGPILASVITVALASSIDAGAYVITFAYSLGTAIPMLAVMIGGRTLLNRAPWLKRNMERIRKLFGVLMIMLAVAISLGWDVRFQSAVLEAFPGYGKNLTALENSDTVTQALKQREQKILPTNSDYTRNGIFTGVDNDVRLEGTAGMYGQAPPLVARGPWINSEPLTMDGLRGKVVLIDFWTYSCINCIRTFPYLREWHEKYSDSGLVIIGVHSPEFAFERELRNVKKAVKDLDVRWPVVLDNGYDQWRSYSNRFWPAHYLIDANGQVRYFRFGEGAYRETEMMIRALLIEGGYSPSAALGNEVNRSYAGTPETYTGLKRAERYSGAPELGQGIRNYEAAADLPLHHWTLDGTWKIGPEYAEAAGRDSSLELEFQARNLYAVISPAAEGSQKQIVRLRLDGEETSLPLDESRMYQLAELKEAGRHHVKIELPEGSRIYAFTFGG